MSLRVSSIIIAGLFLLSNIPLRGGSPTVVESKEPSLYDKIWALPMLYSNAGTPVLQELAITGRYEGQYYLIDSAQVDTDAYESRRIRWGLRARLFHDFELKGQINSDADQGLVYERLWNATLAWKISDALTLTAGKFKPRWSYEWYQASYELLTFERALLVNQARPENIPGLALDGKMAGWNWSLGIFSGDYGTEFGQFDQGAIYSASLGYDFSQSLHLEKAAWRFDYLADDGKEGKTGKGPWDQNFVTSLDLKQGRMGLLTEIEYVTGHTDAAFGMMLMPSYDLTSKLQAVVRYQFAHADGDVLRVVKLYEREAPELTDKGYGDTYHAIYLRLNYRLYGNKWKFMTGLEYARMEGGMEGGDYDGWTWLNGVRLYF